MHMPSGLSTPGLTLNDLQSILIVSAQAVGSRMPYHVSTMSTLRTLLRFSLFP